MREIVGQFAFVVIFKEMLEDLFQNELVCYLGDSDDIRNGGCSTWQVALDLLIILLLALLFK